MKAPELRHGAVSDVGLVRVANEDAFLAQMPLYVVADGMGGHVGGAIASAIVTDEFARLEVADLDARSGAALLVEAMNRCQTRIRSWGETQGDPGAWRAGTTIAAALLVNEPAGQTWLLANLGDSRIYRVRNGELEQITVDHSVVQELVDAGELTHDQARVHPERHVITKALGGLDGVDPDFFLVPLSSAPRLLLCSDGVSGMIEDEQILDILQAARLPGDAADELVSAALAAGGRDNATAIVVDVMGWPDDVDDTMHPSDSPESKREALP